MTLKEILNLLTQQAKKRKPKPVETNGMKEKGVPIHD
jgi:hypothetical protein